MFISIVLEKMVFEFKQIVHVVYIYICMKYFLFTLIIALYILDIHVYKGMWEMRLDHTIYNYPP